jgi:hypothetical protein
MGGDRGACAEGAARRQAAPDLVARKSRDIVNAILYMLRGGGAAPNSAGQAAQP